MKKINNKTSYLFADLGYANNIIDEEDELDDFLKDEVKSSIQNIHSIQKEKSECEMLSSNKDKEDVKDDGKFKV